MFDKALERRRGGEELAYGRDDVAVLALHGPCEQRTRLVKGSVDVLETLYLRSQ